MTTYKQTQEQTQIQEQTQEQTQALAAVEETAIPSISGRLSGQSADLPAPYCSFRATTMESKKRLYQAMTNPQKKIADCINLPIDVKDIFVEWVQMTDQATGEITTAPRVVLFGADGVTYSAVSRGLANSLERLMLVYGLPTWETPIPCVIRQVQAGERRFYTLDIR